MKDVEFDVCLTIVGGADECNDSDGLGWAVCKFLHWIDGDSSGGSTREPDLTMPCDATCVN